MHDSEHLFSINVVEYFRRMRGCGRWKNVEEMGNMIEIYVEERSEVEKMDVELG